VKRGAPSRLAIGLGLAASSLFAQVSSTAGSRSVPPAAGGARAAEWVAVPSDWRPLAELAPAPAAPESPARVSVGSRRAYGDPARGCYALVQEVTAASRGFDERRAMEALGRDLAAAGFTIGPDAAGLRFAGRGFEGRLRATATSPGADRIAVRSVACFYNDREPDQCRRMCDGILDSAEAAR